MLGAGEMESCLDSFFKIPYLNKGKMEREGILPWELATSPGAIHVMH
jgi:hypothetical protein